MEPLETELVRLRSKMMGVAWSILRHTHDAEDAVSNAFVKILRLKPEITCRFSTYVQTAVRNESLNMARSRRRRPNCEVSGKEPAPDDVEAVVTARLDLDKLQTVLEASSPRQHRVLVALLSGMSVREVADQEGIDPATVNTRLHRLRKRLTTLQK